MEPVNPAVSGGIHRISAVLNNHSVSGVLRSTITHNHYVYKTHTQ